MLVEHLPSDQYGAEYIFTTSTSLSQSSASLLYSDGEFSWHSLQRTGRVPDSELNDRFRHTALYVTFRNMITDGFHLEEYEANPQVALVPPTPEEISSRWPGMPAEDVHGLLNDYVVEEDSLGELELDDVYDKIRVLAEEDVEADRSSVPA